MRSSEELDLLHEAGVKRFPAGCSREQFAILTLESADETDLVYPHSLADFFGQHSWLFWMLVEGLIVNRSKHNEPMRWFITDKGREWLACQRSDTALERSVSPQPNMNENSPTETETTGIARDG